MIGPFGRQLILFVTRRCPLRCAHCFNRAGQKEAGAEGPEISVEEAGWIGREVKPISQLSLSGGEPFVRDDLPRLVEAIARQSGARHLDVPTSGWEPDSVVRSLKKILEQATWRRVSLNLSIDGHRELHDRIRGKEGSYDRLIETYRAAQRLRAKGPLALKAVITLMEATAEDLSRTLDALKADMPEVDHAHVEPYRGPDLGEGIKPPSAESMAANRGLVFRLYDSGRLGGPGRRGLGRLAAAMKKVLWDEYSMMLQGKPARIRCRASSLGLVVTETLDVAFCEPGPVLGNLRAQGIREILKGSRARAEAGRIARGCACTHSCFMQPSALLSAWAWTRVPGALLSSGSR